MAKQSILKKRKKNRNSDERKQGVSFASETSTKIFTKEQKTKEKYHEMSNDEEDALDPKNGATENDENAKIREARAARAIKRHTGDIEAFNQKDPAEAQGDSFHGEEVADEKYSLSASNEDGDCPIEPFNLKSEREDGEGYFDGDTYVFRRGKGDEEDDAWLDNLNDSKKDDLSSNSKEGMTTMAMKRKNTSAINDDMTKEEVYEQLLPLLSNDEETILQALSRYGAIVKREKKNKQKTEKSASGNALNKITELCNICMMNFDDGGNIYDFTKTKLQQFLSQSDEQFSLERKRKSNIFDDNVSFNKDRPSKQSKVSESSHASTGKAVFWEYKGNGDNKIHGPYSTKQMIDWIKAGFFVGQMAVDVRIISNGNGITVEKVKEDTVDDLLGDLEDSDNEDDGKEAANETESKWLRSDSVTFDAYL